MSLTLFGTENCHLCDEAYEILVLTVKNLKSSNLVLEKIDIAQIDKFYDLYALKIPVLQLKTMNKTDELCWPFSQADIERMINKKMPI